ncbi:MAG TPA: branched-chain amino acid ABC transporter permease [Acidimicrobiales bacterium]|jgi:branched-chain amino acid transport system permease protein|nr:branched-chain amino acid ABC transporter permease [Acidimicrobiales bacterium]
MSTLDAPDAGSAGLVSAEAAAELAQPVGGGGRVPWVRIAVGIVLAAVALYLPFYYGPDTNKLLSQAIYLAVAAQGLNLLTGFNGQVSIGHGAFFGVGAFTTGILMTEYGWYFEPTIIVAALVAALVGVVVGFPALRVRGLYLALITLGLAVLFPRLASKVVGGDDAIFEGSGGVALLRPERSEFESIVGFLDNDQWEYFLCLIVAVVLFVMARNLISSRMGRAIIATRDREIAAATVGVNLSGVKVGTFALSAAYAGVAGSLAVMVDKVADATNPILYFELSIKFLVAVVIGGAATILGPALGAVVLTFLEDRTDTLIEGKEVLSPALLGIALIVIVFVLPEGLLGGIRRLVNKASTRLPGRRAGNQVNRS